MLTFVPKVEYYCDNLEVVQKNYTLATSLIHFNEQYKTAYRDTVLKLRECLPPHITAFYDKGHEDQRKQNQNLITHKQLNTKADHLIE